MITNINNTYTNTEVLLDNATFKSCVFKNCTLVYSGTGPVSLIDCVFERPSWRFTGAADNTLKFLRALYHGMGDTGKQLVENTFEQIRADQ